MLNKRGEIATIFAAIILAVITTGLIVSQQFNKRTINAPSRAQVGNTYSNDVVITVANPPASYRIDVYLERVTVPTSNTLCFSGTQASGNPLRGVCSNLSLDINYQIRVEGFNLTNNTQAPVKFSGVFYNTYGTNPSPYNDTVTFPTPPPQCVPAGSFCLGIGGTNPGTCCSGTVCVPLFLLGSPAGSMCLVPTATPIPPTPTNTPIPPTATPTATAVPTPPNPQACSQACRAMPFSPGPACIAAVSVCPGGSYTPWQTNLCVAGSICCCTEETGATKCADGIDNDTDGLIDCADPTCAQSCPAATATPTATNTPVPPPVCTENDGGNVPDVGGVVQRGTSFRDSCSPANSPSLLNEYYCDANGNVANNPHTCVNGCVGSGNPAVGDACSTTPPVVDKLSCATKAECGCGVDINQTNQNICVFQNTKYLSTTFNCTSLSFCAGITGNCTPTCINGTCQKSCPPVNTPTPTPTAPVCPAPASISVDTTYKNITWRAVVGATSYDVRIDEDAVSWPSPANCAALLADPNRKGDDCKDGLTVPNYPYSFIPGKTYEIWVHAITACGYSASTKSTFTVPGNPPPATITQAIPLPTIGPTDLTCATMTTNISATSVSVTCLYKTTTTINSPTFTGNFRFTPDAGQPTVKTNSNAIIQGGSMFTGTPPTFNTSLKVECQLCDPANPTNCSTWGIPACTKTLSATPPTSTPINTQPPTPTKTPTPTKILVPTMCKTPVKPILAASVIRNNDQITLSWDNERPGLESIVQVCTNGGGSCGKPILRKITQKRHTLDQKIPSIVGKDIIIEITSRDPKCDTISDVVSVFVPAKAKSLTKIPSITITSGPRGQVMGIVVIGGALVVIILIVVTMMGI